MFGGTYLHFPDEIMNFHMLVRQCKLRKAKRPQQHHKDRQRDHMHFRHIGACSKTWPRKNIYQFIVWIRKRCQRSQGSIRFATMAGGFLVLGILQGGARVRSNPHGYERSAGACDMSHDKIRIARVTNGLAQNHKQPTNNTQKGKGWLG
jgi:hypothetical protein